MNPRMIFRCPHYYRDLLEYDKHEHDIAYSATMRKVIDSYQCALAREPVVKAGAHRMRLVLSHDHERHLHEMAEAFGVSTREMLLIACEQYRNFRNVCSFMEENNGIHRHLQLAPKRKLA